MAWCSFFLRNALPVLISTVFTTALASNVGIANSAENIACAQTMRDGKSFQAKLNLNNVPGLIVGDNGQQFRLANLYFPSQKVPVLKQTISMIAEFLAQSPLIVWPTGPKRDRYGRMPVQVYRPADQDNTWLQLQLVNAGLAIVHPEKDDTSCIRLLLKAEQVARKGGIGLWKRSEDIMLQSNSKDWQNKTDAYRLVEGTVLSVGETESRFYLNFGEDWQSDFTAIVAKRVAKRFNRSIGVMKSLTGKNVRIRGWMVSDRGPMIEVYYPGQIELVLD